MKRWLLILLLGVLTPGATASAQGVLVLPQRLDPARTAVRDAIVVFRDTLHTVRAAEAQFRRDAGTGSSAVLVSRAQRMREACAGSLRVLPQTRETIVQAPAPRDVHRQKRADLVQALDDLSRMLTQCETQFSQLSEPGQAERARREGVASLGRVHADIGQFDAALSAFLTAYGIKLRPVGAGPSPLAG